MKDFLEQYDYFLIDLWGVLWDGREVYPGAVDVCRSLLESDKQVLFVSNCAEYVVDTLIDRMKKAGLEDAHEGWIASAGQSMALWFERHGLTGKKVYVFGGEEVHENTRRAGAEPIEMPKKGTDLREGGESDTLIIGGLLNFCWTRMTEVVTGVHLGGLNVVLPNPDKVVVQQDGRVALAAGMVAQVIEAALPELKIERLGKPFPFIYEYAFSRFEGKVDKGRTLMIGDSLDTDIRGANNAGIDSLLLGQGVHSGQSEETIQRLARERDIRLSYFAPTMAWGAPVSNLNGSKP